MHSSHRTRFSGPMTFDEICELCGAHDEDHLRTPCKSSDDARAEYDRVQEARRLAAAVKSAGRAK